MGELRKLAVIGDPVSHSLSPLLYSTMAKTLGLAYTYEARRVPGGQLELWLRQVREEGWAGFNATMPHKLDLLPLLDHLTEQARYFGAVNAVRNDHGILTGTNTDGAGFAWSLQDHHRSFAGGTVAILGAGGAAGAIARQARLDGAAKILILNRSLERAAALCREAPQTMQPLLLTQPLPQNLDLLINTVPSGNHLDWGFVKNLSKGCAVFDILYAPPRTPLLLAAQEAGLTAVNGLGMLLHQAIDSFVFYTGHTVDRREMAAILFDKLNSL